MISYKLQNIIVFEGAFRNNMEKLQSFTLKNGEGVSADILTYGGIVQRLYVPGRDGEARDIVCGYDTPEEYMADPGAYFGAVIGRCANRIKGGRFTLNGREYALSGNDGVNHLHGGYAGFDKKIWTAEGVKEAAGGQSLSLTLRSPDGEEGYPGNLDVRVTYTLTRDNRLITDYEAVSDADTVCSLTGHCYFNLAGHGSGGVLKQILQINAGKVTEVSAGLIPTDRLLDLGGAANACLDFRSPKPIGGDIYNKHYMLETGGGYDFNYVLDKAPGENLFQKAAEAYDEGTGIRLEVWTDRPGVHFYSGNFIGGRTGKGGAKYGKHAGFCLETQSPPDAINSPAAESVILRAGKKYKTRTVLTFSTR